MAWNEDRLHRWLAARPRPPALVGSRGHDAAVLRPAAGRQVICADQTVEGVHFLAGTPAARVAAKACGRALSDLAATAASPVALLLTVRAAADVEESWLRRLLGAVARRGAAAGAPLVGGDLCCAPGPLGLSVTALDQAAPGGGPLAGPGRRPGPDGCQRRPGVGPLPAGAQLRCGGPPGADPRFRRRPPPGTEDRPTPGEPCPARRRGPRAARRCAWETCGGSVGRSAAPLPRPARHRPLRAGGRPAYRAWSPSPCL